MKIMRKVKNKLSTRQRAQALTEFALFVTVLFLIIAGTVDFGRAFFYFNTIRDAAGEGAFYGSFDPTNTTEIEKRVRKTSASPIDLTDTSLVTVDINTIGSPCAGNTIQVTVTYQFTVVTPFIGVFLGGQTIPLSSTMSHTILNPACF
jgi:Flp pilus assembly protein TadG